MICDTFFNGTVLKLVFGVREGYNDPMTEKAYIEADVWRIVIREQLPSDTTVH